MKKIWIKLDDFGKPIETKKYLFFESPQIHVPATFKWKIKEIYFEVHIFRYIYIRITKFQNGECEVVPFKFYLYI